ncbi:hypothetical protein ACVWZ6_002410 [Bradyrhizobium sp. GM6.1]
MGVRAKIEDLRGEGMGDRNDGDFRLFAQIEPEAQSSVSGEVANENIRQWAVVLLFIGGTLYFPALIFCGQSICCPSGSAAAASTAWSASE